MCLLIVLSRTHVDAPLIVAANRDEWFARPATASAVLRAHPPRTIGGRDELAGGTWLATNEHGVFAGLTNRPTLERDPTKRSRGELPLLLTAHTTARAAVEEVARLVRPTDYGPAWLFVGDRTSLFLVDMTHGEEPGVTELPPGVHVLENRAWAAPSCKVEHVHKRVAPALSLEGAALRMHLYGVLRDHTIPEGEEDSGVPGFVRPRETEACCVHAGRYGTRSASLVVVSRDPSTPRVWSSAGPPCTHALEERTALFASR